MRFTRRPQAPQVRAARRSRAESIRQAPQVRAARRSRAEWTGTAVLWIAASGSAPGVPTRPSPEAPDCLGAAFDGDRRLPSPRRRRVGPRLVAGSSRCRVGAPRWALTWVRWRLTRGRSESAVGHSVLSPMGILAAAPSGAARSAISGGARGLPEAFAVARVSAASPPPLRRGEILGADATLLFEIALSPRRVDGVLPAVGRAATLSGFGRSAPTSRPGACPDGSTPIAPAARDRLIACVPRWRWSPAAPSPGAQPVMRSSWRRAFSCSWVVVWRGSITPLIGSSQDLLVFGLRGPAGGDAPSCGAARPLDAALLAPRSRSASPAPLRIAIAALGLLSLPDLAPSGSLAFLC
jgi:hypothetical protein